MSVIVARGRGGAVSIENINITLDLSGQIDGIKNEFDIGEEFRNLRVYYNGVNTTTHVSGTTATTFLLDFVPAAGPKRELIAVYDKL